MQHGGRSRRDVIVIGASAGGIAALRTVLAALPAKLEAAIGITVHRSPSYASSLASIFSRVSALELVEPEGGERFQARKVYLAPADRHMTVQDGRLALDRGPQEHHTRPAVDPLFRSVAREYGDRVIGIVLTGNLDDGTSGLLAISSAGGVTLAQDPAEAEYPSMPMNALLHDHVDVTCRLDVIAALLPRLVAGDSVASLDTAGVKICRR